MHRAEQHKLAEQLSNGSDLLDFESALEIVQWRPDEARQILQTRAEMRRRREERAHNRKQRKRALIEDFG